MGSFPRTMVESVSLPRLIPGTNWLLGFSHQTQAKDRFIKEHQTSERMAAIMEVFLEAGCDAILGYRPDRPELIEGVKKAEDKVGRGMIRIGTPDMNLAGTSEALDQNKRKLDAFAGIGCRFCMPHQCSTDALIDRIGKKIVGMEAILALIRERGMVPGLSTHTPEAVPYADKQGLDVATYIQIYNAAGFLMQIEVDWVHRIIWSARHPVITIKPMAAGRLPPLVGLAFNWATIRPQDMVCIGCMTPDEARECLDISLAQLEGRGPSGSLQTTRSKSFLNTSPG